MYGFGGYDLWKTTPPDWGQEDERDWEDDGEEDAFYEAFDDAFIAWCEAEIDLSKAKAEVCVNG